MATTQVHGTPDQTPSGPATSSGAHGPGHVGVRDPDPVDRGRAPRGEDHQGDDDGATPAVAPAATGVVRAMASLPDAVFDAVGAPQSVDPGLALLTGQPALSIGGRPAVVYVGAEFCPFCAAERWALVAALDRFGSFSHLGATSSSDDEVFPGHVHVLLRRHHLPEPLRHLRLGRGVRGPALGPCPRRVPQAPRPHAARMGPRPALRHGAVRARRPGPFPSST